jgi:hypothetical protein
LVAQTTQDEKIFKIVAAAIQEKFPEARIFKTICDSTHRRLEEVISLARRAEANVVVGGKGRLIPISSLKPSDGSPEKISWSSRIKGGTTHRP